METKPCTYIHHVDGKSCLDYAIGCDLLCECCMGELVNMALGIKTMTYQGIPIYVEEKLTPYQIAKAHQGPVPSSNWVVPDWE